MKNAKEIKKIKRRTRLGVRNVKVKNTVLNRATQTDLTMS